MDSINRKQPEEHRADVRAGEAVMLIGAAIGKTLDDSIEGMLRV